MPVTVSGNNFFVSDIESETNKFTFEINKVDSKNEYINHFIRYTAPLNWY
ncbi:hypothetical protein I580_02062 [Enterococcus caccae ATCC BAA-1240]|uniref:Uncharacterized protein n=1 Tax=Enterococcus caccae ATCC BAA-1240 TaxID=1158612 RepID=R3TWJ7_9ENTE|nr:hypothetical protein UC7_01761 [Enterococcus caccae ATCC BAA-1240]EOT61160.1 hypothetical protein I580_02062 [Enterococcus caccae ATCC BAA-1240]